MNDKYEEETNYQFEDHQEPEGIEAISNDEEAPSSKGRFSQIPFVDKLKNRRVLFVVGFIILVIVIYNLLGHSAGPSSHTNFSNIQKVPHPKIVNPAQSLPAQPQSAQKNTPSIATAAMGMKPAAIKPIAKNPEMGASGSGVSQMDLNKLERTMRQESAKQINAAQSQYQNQIDTLTNENQALSSKVSGLSDKVSDLNEQIILLSDKLKLIIKHEASIESSIGASFNANGETSIGKMPQKAQAPLAAMPHYLVQAVIPGRAWLKSSGGHILSVSKGSAIPGYGNVVDIDAINGIVSTSTGSELTTSNG
jgi:hypothetical protein